MIHNHSSNQKYHHRQIYSNPRATEISFHNQKKKCVNSHQQLLTSGLISNEEMQVDLCSPIAWHQVLLWGKNGKKQSETAQKIGERSELNSRLDRFPSPDYSFCLFVCFFFSPFSPTAEPGPRLILLEQTHILQLRGRLIFYGILQGCMQFYSIFRGRKKMIILCTLAAIILIQ